MLGESQPFIRNIFTLNTCSHIVGSQVIEHKKEQDMLIGWRNFINEADPDVIIGYNIAGFDLPYLLDRADALKVGDRFARLGRLPGQLFFMKSLPSFTHDSRLQASKPSRKMPISRLKLTDKEIRKKPPLMVGFNSIFFNTCNENRNCEVTLSTLFALIS